MGNRPEPRTFNEGLDIVLAENRALMLRKQNDYGPSNITALGNRGVFVRVWDKIARLKNLLWDHPNRQTANESIEDSWRDLSNYGVLAILNERGWMTLPFVPPDRKDTSRNGELDGSTTRGTMDESSVPVRRDPAPLHHARRASSNVDAMDFGDAIRALRAGHRVARWGWNGKGMFLLLIDPYVTDQFTLAESPEIVGTLRSYIAMKTADNGLVPWLASQTDMLADDWEIVG